MKHVFLILYLLFSGIHLYHSWKDDAARRALTKPVLLMLLALHYAACAVDLSWVLLLALLTSWLGDVLLILKGHKWFARGGISFLVSHFLFIAVYLPDLRLNAVPWLLLLLVAPVYFGISMRIIRAVEPTTPKSLIKPMGLYLLTNSAMNLFALIRMLTVQSPGSLVAYLGAVLFFASDCTLFLVRYYQKPDVVFKKHFTVMFTYLVGELFITVGILMH